MKTSHNTILNIEHLYKNYHSYVSNIVLKYVRDTDLAEDLTQDIFIKIMLNIEKFQWKSSFTTWIYSVSRNHVFNYFNTQKRDETIVTFMKSDPFYTNIDTSVFDDEELSLKIAYTQVIVQELSEDEKNVYILGELLGLKSPDGSRILGMSAQNFRKKLSRAREKMVSLKNKCCIEGDCKNDMYCRDYSYSDQDVSNLETLEDIFHIDTDQHSLLKEKLFALKKKLTHGVPPRKKKLD